MARFLFGRRQSETFADSVEIVMPVRALVGTVWPSIIQAKIEETIDTILQAVPVPAYRAVNAEAGNSVSTFFGNTIFLSVGEGESALDFYHLPPREIHLAKTQKKDIHLLPVIRIIISSVLSKQLLIVLRTFAERTNRSRPIQEGGRRAAI